MTLLSIYITGALLLWMTIHRRHSALFSVALTQSIAFALITLFVVVSQLLFASTNYTYVSLAYLTSSIFLYKKYPRHISETGPSSYTAMLALVICMVVIYVYGYNGARHYPYVGQSLPVVGTNDDNANHMALSIVALKDGAMLPSSTLLKQMVTNSIVNPSTAWYPFGLYTNMQVGYDLFRRVLTNSTHFDLRSFFTFNTFFTVGLLLNMTLLFFCLTNKLYKIRSLYGFPILLAMGIFVLMGESLLKLQIYGFHSQLAGYCIFTTLLILLNDAKSTKSPSLTQTLLISLCVLVTGWTYYLFIPLTGCAYFLYHTSTHYKSRQLYIPYFAWVLSTIPLIYFHLYHPVGDQSSAYGVAFVSFTGLMTATLGVLLGIMIRKANDFLRMELVVLFGLNVVMMIVATVSMFTNTGNLGYYFFKSYWTMSILGLPLLFAFVGYAFDHIKNLSTTPKVILSGLSLLIASVLFYLVFSQNGFDPRGYDGLLLVHNGNANYAIQQKKWIQTYEKYKGTNGENIFVTGIWGQMVLSYAVFEDMPWVARRRFIYHHYEFGNEYLMELHNTITRRIKDGIYTILLDNMGGVRTINSMINDAESNQLFKDSKYLE